MLQPGSVKYNKKTIFLVLLVFCLAFLLSNMMHFSGIEVQNTLILDSMESESKEDEKPREFTTLPNFYRGSETGGQLSIMKSLTEQDNLTEHKKHSTSREQPENQQYAKRDDPQFETTEDQQFRKPEDLQFENPKDPLLERQLKKTTRQKLVKPWDSNTAHNIKNNISTKKASVRPNTRKAKPEEVSIAENDHVQEIHVKKVNTSIEVGIPEYKSPGKLDFSRLDLLALGDESINLAWDKQTEMEKKTKYKWRHKESDPVPSRPPSFQEVKKDILWVYSSFYVPPNNGTEAILKGLGLVQNEFLNKKPYVYCHLHKKGKAVLVMKGNFSIIFGKVGEQYSTTWMICPLPYKFQPNSVTFTIMEKEVNTNIVPVVYPGKKPLRNFTVCHPALYGPFDSPEQLLHSWETYRALGAEHIYIYNMDVSYRTERVLQAYERAGLLTVLPWDREPSIKAHYRSQWISINDCVYRNRNVSRYVLVHDTDEIIVPQKNYSGWYDMVKVHESMQFKKGRKTAAFGVRSSFFCKEPSRDEWQKAIKKYNISTEEEAFMHRYNVTPFLKTSHDEIFRWFDRAKNIIAPENIETMGIHRVKTFMPGYLVQVLTPENALTFHLRQKKCKSTISSVVDLRILKYHKLCYERLSKIYKQIDPLYLHI